MFGIGEFSKVTGLTIKTLRFYHDQGILEPSYVDSGSGYRYYDESKVETARVIAALRDLEFPIAKIKEIVAEHEDDADILQRLQARKAKIQKRMLDERQIVRKLDEIIHHAQEVKTKMSTSPHNVQRKEIEPQLIAAQRMVGRYSDCGKGFSKIARKFGRHLCGKSMMLHHDNEYREDDANFEVAMPIRKGKSTDDIEVRELPGGECLSLMHLGPYEELGRSYETIIKYAKENGFEYAKPTREVYHKGPGMIFRGNPKKYVTEIQFMISGA